MIRSALTAQSGSLNPRVTSSSYVIFPPCQPFGCITDRYRRHSSSTASKRDGPRLRFAPAGSRKRSVSQSSEHDRHPSSAARPSCRIVPPSSEFDVGQCPQCVCRNDGTGQMQGVVVFGKPGRSHAVRGFAICPNLPNTDPENPRTSYSTSFELNAPISVLRVQICCIG